MTGPDHGDSASDRPDPGGAKTEPDGAAANHTAGGAYHCERCGSLMIERHCKIECPNCGYQRDCSDP